MTSYTQDELISSSKIVKNFWSYLSKVSNNELEKIWILKNNTISWVLISGDMYEMFQEFMEHADIYNSIKDRLESGSKIEGDKLLEEFGLSL